MEGGGEECEVDCGGTQVGDLANRLPVSEIAISGSGVFGQIVTGVCGDVVDAMGYAE